MTQPPPTPDFYEYPWDPVDSVAIDDRFVIVAWADRTELRAFDLWLQENALSYAGFDLATREHLIDPADLDDDLRVVSATVRADGALDVAFSDGGPAATYHPGWLRHVAEGNFRSTSWLPEQVSWTADSLHISVHDGATILDDESVFHAWLTDLVSLGLGRLENCPLDEDFVVSLVSRIGAIRDTNFGLAWDVRADIEMAGSDDTNSTANTNLRLGPHTDLPTRETPPGYQFLHCLRNEARGGNSTMADGAAIVAALQAEHPEHYEALTTLNWVFFNRGPGIDHRWTGPFIDLGVDGSPLTLRAFYPVRAFPDMDPSDMPRAYAAMAHFSQMAASDRFEVSTPFRPGDLVGFDNRRILHGRDSFSSGGHRHLRGTYIDHDEIYSSMRVANRRRATHS